MKRLFVLCLSILFLLPFATKAQVIPQSGLVAYFPFNGNANDATANGNNGVLGGSSQPVLTTDRFGNPNSAYEFGGYNNVNWIRVPNSTSMRFTNAFTISCWILHTDFYGMSSVYGTGGQTRVNDGTELHCIIAKGGSGYTDPTYGTNYNNPGIFLTSAPKASTNTSVIAYTNTNGTSFQNANQASNSEFKCLQKNEWVHVVLVVDGIQVRTYFNGCLYDDVSQDVPSFTSANSQDLYIGRSNCPSSQTAYFPFCGKIDDIAIYNRALTDSEIKLLFGGFSDAYSADNQVFIDNVQIENPCGTRMGRVTMTPRPGQTYQYAEGSRNNVQTSNVLTAQLGTHRFYAVSNCGVYDTVITFVCDCSETPGSTLYDSICPGQSGTRGSIETIYDGTTNASLNQWTRQQKWEIGTHESNYLDAGFPSWAYSGYSGNSFFCPTYYGYFSSSTSYLISPAITISNPARASLSFAYLAVAMSDGATNGFNTLKLEWATSPSGPWTSVWNSGGGDVDPWRTYSGSLASLPSGGTYYFRFTNTGRGYVSGIDNFVIKEDNRTGIPAAVSAGAPGTTVPITDTISMPGFCDSTVTTLWYIKPNTFSYDTVTAHRTYTWRDGRTFTESGDYQKLSLRNALGCDSSAYLHLTLTFDNDTHLYYTACDSFYWFGQRFLHTDSATLHYPNIWGGDSAVICHVKINYTKRRDTVAHECLNFTWRNYLYDSTQILVDSTISTEGCDSIVTLHLFIHSGDTIVNRINACDSFYWAPLRQTLDTTGIYERHFLNRRGCDSLQWLDLSIWPSYLFILPTDTVGNKNLPWMCPINQQSYSHELHNEPANFKSAHQCDSIYLINLYVKIVTDTCEDYLQFPNLVTPNGDGVNDVFRIAGLLEHECYPYNDLRIYNRWGALVFRAKNISKEEQFWNPTNMPAGTYFFFFVGESYISKVERRGAIEIIR